jgi:hypothetical protein
VPIWIASLRAGYQDHICLIGEAAAASIGFGARDDAGWLGEAVPGWIWNAARSAA